ncbi:MAG: hypothetical protein K2Q15_16485 [Burkholderiales bacterium]|nr:hypothetical protein [Burkholderiales bacterium]
MTKPKHDKPVARKAKTSSTEADGLKLKFAAQSIPLEADFAQLIEMADVGYRAMGEGSGDLGDGLEVGADGKGKVKVKPDLAQAILVSTEGVGVSVATNKGIVIEGNALAVKVGLGISVGEGGVALDGGVIKGNGLAWASNLLSVNAQEAGGIKVESTGIAVNVADNKGTILSENILAVKTGFGLGLNTIGLNVALASGYPTYDNGGGGCGTNGCMVGSAGGLNVNENGLCVNAGKGLQIDSTGLSVKCAVGGGLVANEGGGVSLDIERLVLHDSIFRGCTHYTYNSFFVITAEKQGYTYKVYFYGRECHAVVFDEHTADPTWGNNQVMYMHKIAPAYYDIPREVVVRQHLQEAIWSHETTDLLLTETLEFGMCGPSGATSSARFKVPPEEWKPIV